MSLTNTALDDDDGDLLISEDGYTAITPSFDEDEMLLALEEPSTTEPQAELAPQEAYEAMKFQAPLSAEEQLILATTPGLRGLRWIDDPDHTEYLLHRAADAHKGMDEVLEDEMYGTANALSPRALSPRLRGLRVSLGPARFAKLARRRGLRRLARAVDRPGVLGELAEAGLQTRHDILGAWIARKKAQRAWPNIARAIGI